MHAQIYVTGMVQDITSGKGVSGAWVQAGGEATSVTDSLGNFQMQVSAFPDSASLIVRHLGYEQALPPVILCDVGKGTCHVLIRLQPADNLFAPVTITASRAKYNQPVTYTNISGPALHAENTGQDMPYLLRMTPGVVVTSDAGNGVGYTYIKIRGSDASRVNITINGVPYNDAESEQTYWVDLPDFAASVDDIQIQRGIGTSTYGISSLGASVNINTNDLNETPYAGVDLAAGSYGLNRESASFGTGRIHNHWYAGGRVSRIYSDGYVDRAYAHLSSFFLLSAYRSKHFLSVLDIFSGNEKTYQAWDGVPKDSLETNRTYNPFTYANQTDNYLQTHYQWHNTLQLSSRSSLRLTLNYTHGDGYYEEYESDQYLPDYGVAPQVSGTDTAYFSDLITRKWLDNDFSGAYLQYAISFPNKGSLTIGSAYYSYFGKHYGKVIWSGVSFPGNYDYTWYSDNAAKQDGNVFVQLDYPLTQNLHAWADIQERVVQYDFVGLDEYAVPENRQVRLPFFNPKIGLSRSFGSRNLVYLFLGRSSKEPNRDDYVSSSPLHPPKPETLYDAEAGTRLYARGWLIQADLYYMYYHDQLILNGEINDVGEYTRINVPSSYRSGIELAWSRLFFEKLGWNANIALSVNRIPDYTEYVDNWDDGSQAAFHYDNTSIAFSPSVVAASSLSYTLFSFGRGKADAGQGVSLRLDSKFVSRQYIDNTENSGRSLDPYFLNDLTLGWDFHTRVLQTLHTGISVLNILDVQYASNAWVYRYIYGMKEEELNGYFPQAGRTFVVMIAADF